MWHLHCPFPGDVLLHAMLRVRDQGQGDAETKDTGAKVHQQIDKSRCRLRPMLHRTCIYKASKCIGNRSSISQALSCMDLWC